MVLEYLAYPFLFFAILAVWYYFIQWLVLLRASWTSQYKINFRFKFLPITIISLLICYLAYSYAPYAFGFNLFYAFFFSALIFSLFVNLTTLDFTRDKEKLVYQHDSLAYSPTPLGDVIGGIIKPVDFQTDSWINVFAAYSHYGLLLTFGVFLFYLILQMISLLVFKKLS